MRIRWWVVSVALFGSGCVHRFECTVHGGRPVRQVETEHFVVTSDLDEPVLVQQAKELEQLWASWVLFFRHTPKTTAKLEVVLGEGGTSDAFVANSAGFVRYNAEPLLMSDVRVVETREGTKFFSANAHEMAHFISHFWLRRQPRWLAEGLAQYLDDAQFVRDNVVRMGRWQWNGSPVESLQTLWEWGKPGEAADIQAELYSASWAWFHFLSNKEEARLWALLEAMRTAPSARRAFEAVFPRAEWAKLYERLQAYLEAGRFRGWETRDLLVPTVSKPRTLEPWEVHLIRRKYVDGEALQREETKQAVALAGATPPAEVTLARFQDEVRGPDESEVLFHLPHDARAQWLASYAPDLPPKQRFELAERAALALPDNVRVQQRFAALAAERKDPRALIAAERALAMAPWWDAPYFDRASALVAAGRCADAKATLEDVRSLAVDGDNRLPRRVDALLEEFATSCKEAQ